MIVTVIFAVLFLTLPYSYCTTTTSSDGVVVVVDNDDKYHNLETIMQYFEKDDMDKCQDIFDKTPMPTGLAFNLSRIQFKNELIGAQSVYDLMSGQNLNNENQIKDLLNSYLLLNPLITEATLMTKNEPDLSDTVQNSKPNSIHYYIATRTHMNDKRNINFVSLTSIRNENTIHLNRKKFINFFTNFYDDRSRFNFIDVDRRSSSLPSSTASPKPDIVWQQYCDDFIHRQWRIGFIFVRQIVSTGSQFNGAKRPIFFVSLPLERLDLNQCDIASLPSELRGTHGCHKTLTTCVHIPNGGFRLGSYNCCCNTGVVPTVNECYNGTIVEEYRKENTDFQWPCLSSVVFADLYDHILRKVLLSINVLCAMFAFAMIFVAMTQRNMQDWGARGWALMELFLFGAILLYCIVVLEFFNPQIATCCLITWCRELGFVLFFGPIVLKIHRNLIEHRVRRAHRSYVKEKDLLKYLCCLLAFTITGLTAWTLTAIDSAQIDERTGQSELISVGKMDKANLSYYVCTIFKWNLAWNGFEFLLLLYGCYLSYKARSTAWLERRQFAAAVLIEMVVTVTVNILRYNLWQTSGPNFLYVLSFIQVHATVTLIICMILASKFYYASYDQNSRTASFVGSVPGRAHPSLARLRDNLMNGTIDFAEIPIGEMNPEDIKAELKRVYTQLRMYKLTNLYVDNPHISKRKGGKKTSNKQTPRRVSTPGIASKSQKDQVKRWEAEERSSLMKGSDDETVVSPSDLTVQSSPHNAYLSRNSLAATKKLQLDSDLSVRI